MNSAITLLQSHFVERIWGSTDLSPLYPAADKKIGEVWALDIQDLFIPDDDGTVNRIGFNQLENGHGETPTKQQEERWKEGRVVLYLANYDFLIEKRSDLQGPCNIAITLR